MQGRAFVLAVEKPGVAYLDNPSKRGVATGCKQSFLREHTLDRWAGAVDASIRAATELSVVDENRIAIIGHSEGAATAAAVVAANPKIQAVGLLSGSGGTQLFDLLLQARQQGIEMGENDEEITTRVEKVIKTFREILADPQSIKRFAWGHPFKRWYSFISHSTVESLMQSSASIYIAHGTKDRTVPVESVDYLVAELLRRGHTDVTLRYIAGADHSLVSPKKASVIEAQEWVLKDFVDWWLGMDRRMSKES